MDGTTKPAADGVIAQEPGMRGLMLRGLDGDAAAYRAVLLAVSGYLRTYFRRRLPPTASDVEDLVQETLLTLHEKRHTYRRDEPLTPWVFAIARYKLLQRLRQGARRPTTELEAADEVSDPRNPEEGAIRHDLRRLLSRLPLRQRRLLAAIKLGGLSVTEAAQQEGMSDGAAKVSVHRALKALSAKVRHEN